MLGYAGRKGLATSAHYLGFGDRVVLLVCATVDEWACRKVTRC